MRKWYYTQEGQQRGPITEPDLIRLFEIGLLTSDTLVWTETMDEWAPARDVEGLVPSAYNPPPPPVPRPVTTPPLVSGYTPSGEQVRPWVRYCARTVDFFVFCIPAGIVLALVYEPALDIPDTLFGMVLLFAYVFVEPAMLAGWGTTPGKALLRVRLRNHDGSKLSYAEGFSRSLKVWFRGEGIGIPIVALFTQIYAYSRLTKKGITSWDEDGHSTVSHQTIEAWRVIVTTLIFAAFLFLLVLGETDM